MTAIIVRLHPEMALFHDFCVNWRRRLCGVLKDASAQLLDFLELVKISSVLNRKLTGAKFSFMHGHQI